MNADEYSAYSEIDGYYSDIDHHFDSLFDCSVETGRKRKMPKREAKSKEQSTKGKESVIDQELKKQYRDVSTRLIEYKIEQDAKAH